MLAIGAKVLSNPIAAMVAKAALGNGIEGLQLPIGNPDLLREMWEELSEDMQDDGGRELVKYAADNMDEAANDVAQRAETSERVAARPPPLSVQRSRTVAAVPQRASEALRRSYTTPTLPWYPTPGSPHPWVTPPPFLAARWQAALSSLLTPPHPTSSRYKSSAAEPNKK